MIEVIEQKLPPYFLSQQRPSLQGFLGLVLLSDGQQGLEELCRLRRENFEGAGVEELTGALWEQACNTAEQPVVRTLTAEQQQQAKVSLLYPDSLCF